jgi:hypothetical protein
MLILGLRATMQASSFTCLLLCFAMRAKTLVSTHSTQAHHSLYPVISMRYLQPLPVLAYQNVVKVTTVSSHLVQCSVSLIWIQQSYCLQSPIG